MNITLTPEQAKAVDDALELFESAARIIQARAVQGGAVNDILQRRVAALEVRTLMQAAERTPPETPEEA